MASGREGQGWGQGERKIARVICRTGQSSPTCCPVPLPVWPCGCCCCCLRCSPDAVVMSACCCPCPGYTRCPAAACPRLTQHLCQRNWPEVTEPPTRVNIHFIILTCFVTPVLPSLASLSGMPPFVTWWTSGGAKGAGQKTAAGGWSCRDAQGEAGDSWVAGMRAAPGRASDSWVAAVRMRAGGCTACEGHARRCFVMEVALPPAR